MELTHTIKMDLTDLESKIQKEVLEFVNRTGLKPEINLDFSEVFETGIKAPIITHVKVSAKVEITGEN